jgi:hypothetical protein
MKPYHIPRKSLGLLVIPAVVAMMSMLVGCESVSYRHDVMLYQNGKKLGEWRNVQVINFKACSENGKEIRVLPANGIAIQRPPFFPLEMENKIAPRYSVVNPFLNDGRCGFRSGGVVILTQKTGSKNGM